MITNPIYTNVKKPVKVYLKIYYVKAGTLKEAVSKHGKLTHVIETKRSETASLVEAIGIEVDKREWDDEAFQEIGY